MRRTFFLTFLFSFSILLSGCMSPEQYAEAQVAETEQLLQQGLDQLQQNNTQYALKKFIDKVIHRCQWQYKSKDAKYYAAASQTETLYYLLLATKEQGEAVVVDTTCADALYLKGYGLIDLGRVKEAETFVQQALSMSPINSTYLSELGHIYTLQAQWQAAVDSYRLAEEYAEKYIVGDKKALLLGRAKRGLGYALIELGRLDEAEVKFRECLEINQDDAKARQELDYIQQLRKQPQ